PLTPCLSHVSDGAATDTRAELYSELDGPTVTGYKNPQCRPGRQCKRFLGPRNYCGVQVSPPNEHRIFVSTDPSDPTFRPWWERYQRIYVDAVVNHMAMGRRYGRGSGGSYYNAEREDFPGVPFSPRNFNGHGRDVCPTDDLTIHDYRDAIQVRKLPPSLDWWTPPNRHRLRPAYFNELISLGVAGFRIDAAKHMWPQDIAGILNRTHNLIESEFGPNQRPFVYQEVIDLKGNGEPIKNAEYTPRSPGSPSSTMAESFRRQRKFELPDSVPTRPTGMSIWWPLRTHALVFIDNHDNQRGHGGGSNDILTFRRPTAFELVDSYGWPRIMSSYYWGGEIVNGKGSTGIGPPSGPDGTDDQVQIGTDDQCLGRWVCEHRWPAIRRAVQVRRRDRGSVAEDDDCAHGSRHRTASRIARATVWHSTLPALTMGCTRVQLCCRRTAGWHLLRFDDWGSGERPQSLHGTVL
uniref:alpha-amylase n=1 Tax=Macrostomum lignano TaxID=282301 RepID=A0A1I8FDY7_9PLAT